MNPVDAAKIVLNDGKVPRVFPTDCIVITMEGGVIHDISNIPKGMKIEVWDFDVEGVDEDRIEVNIYGDEFCLSIWAGK